MDFERSILNKTNSTYKRHTADSHSHSSATSSVDDAVLSHFRVATSPMSSLPEPKELRVDRQGVISSTQANEYHADDRLKAMAEVVSNPSYSQQFTCYHPLHFHTTEAPTHSNYHLPTPSTSPQDYSPPDCIPSAPDVPTPAATPAEGVVYGDGDATEIDPEEDRRNAMPAATPTTNGSNQQVKCQYKQPGVKNYVCDVNGKDKDGKDNNPFLRKTVSHIFGRNKTCTQLIPKERWIWFCRKHYQRHRYDVPNWALEQVRIVRETLVKLEQWGQIRSFSVALRKREQTRKRDSADSADSADTPASRRRTTGRITASRAQAIRTKAHATASGQPMAATPYPSISQEPEVTSTGRRKSFPVNVASPVPDFLYFYLGHGKSFADIRHILNEIEKHVHSEQIRYNKEVSFPDIEILPVFTEGFLQSQGRATAQMSGNNHSRRRRARSVRLSQAQPPSRINDTGCDVSYHPTTIPAGHTLPPITQTLAYLNSSHDAWYAHPQSYHDAQTTHTMGHTHLPPFPPTTQIDTRPSYSAELQ